MTPVVLIHGVGLDRTMWMPVARLLDRMKVVYDMIGLGNGPRPPGPYSLRQYSEQLADLVGKGPVDVVGFSMGALVAQRFALDHPSAVRRLVLVSGVYDRTPEERAAIIARVAEVRAGGYHASIEPALQRWFTAEFASSHPDVIDTVRQRMLTNDPVSYANAYEVFATGDAELTDTVNRITAPTLVITGELDARSTPLMTQRLAAVIPNARSVVMPGLRHLIPLEAPDALAGVIGPFLEQEIAS